jgi:glycosyltransferase involved in cell wall biosynthesis
VKRFTRARWVADLRDSLVSHAHRRREIRGEATLARIVARQADGVVCVSPSIAAEMEAIGTRGPLRIIGNGCDFDDFTELPYRRSERFRITHTGSFFARRDPRPFLEALARCEDDVVVRFVGDLRERDLDHARRLGIGDRVELVPYLPRAEALALQRDSEALLLIVPEAAGRGKGILTGKVYEYLAAERPILAAVPPDGEAAKLIRENRAGVIAAADDVDGLTEALQVLVGQWRGGGLDAPSLSPERRAALSRRARAVELSALLEEIR